MTVEIIVSLSIMSSIVDKFSISNEVRLAEGYYVITLPVHEQHNGSSSSSSSGSNNKKAELSQR